MNAILKLELVWFCSENGATICHASFLIRVLHFRGLSILLTLNTNLLSLSLLGAPSHSPLIALLLCNIHLLLEVCFVLGQGLLEVVVVVIQVVLCFSIASLAFLLRILLFFSETLQVLDMLSFEDFDCSHQLLLCGDASTLVEVSLGSGGHGSIHFADRNHLFTRLAWNQQGLEVVDVIIEDVVGVLN